MAEENTAIVTLKEEQRNQNPLENLLSHFENFKLQFHQPKKQSNSEVVLFKEEAKKNKTQKPDVVRFPERRKVPEPIKLHEEDPETTNDQKSPAVMWQIYAVGAYVIARWAWSQWQKRKDLKNPSDNDEQNSN